MKQMNPVCLYFSAVFFGVLLQGARADAFELREGLYVAKLDIRGPFYVAQIEIDGEGGYRFRDGYADSQMPEPGCIGNYTIRKNIFRGKLDCKAVGGGSLTQTIDLSTVNEETLNSKEGASVQVISSGFANGQAVPFRLFRHI